MSFIIKKESETTDKGLVKHYDIFEKTRSNKTLPKMHTHSYYEILLVNEGALTYKIELDTQVRLSKGDILFVPPFVPHGTYREQDGEMRCTVVKFSTSFLAPAELTRSDVGCLLNSPEYKSSYYVFRSDGKETQSLRDSLSRSLALVSNKSFGYETALRGELTCLFVDLLRICDNDLAQKNDINIDTSISEQFRYVLQYINTNYQYQISMEELANKCDMSYYAFSRFFKQITGKTFSEYLLDTRLSYAQKSLLSDNRSVSEISSACGFEYVSYFIRRFKQKYGVTPLEYRKMYRTQE